MKVRKINVFNHYRFEEIEQNLVEYGKKGLFLEKANPFFWTYKKGEPKELKYSIKISTFEKDNKVNNEENSDWQEVAQIASGMVKIFKSENKEAIPFMHDQKSTFEIIKKQMIFNLTLLAIVGLLIPVYVINKFNLYYISSYDFFKLPVRFYLTLLCYLYVIYFIYSLISYFIWSTNSKKTLMLGEKIHYFSNGISIVVEKFFSASTIILMAILLSYFLSGFKESWKVLVLIIFILVPAFTFSFKYLKDLGSKSGKDKIIKMIKAFFIIYVYILVAVGLSIFLFL